MSNLIYPEYTNDPIYQTLLSIGEQAGIKVKFVEKDEYAMGRASWNYPREVSFIQMMNNYDYQTQEIANFTLAHEIAHCLVDGYYSSEAHYLYPDNEVMHRFIEADADKIGAALYALADRTVAYEQMKKFPTDTE